MTARQKLRRRQLDERGDALRKIVPVAKSRSGWIRAIRSALGMSIETLAKRMGLSPTALQSLEKGEVSGSSTVRSLRRVADALDCDLVVALVPRKRLEDMIRERAVDVARRRLMKTNRTMALENQAIPEARLEEMAQDLADDLVQRSLRELWKE